MNDDLFKSSNDEKSYSTDLFKVPESVGNLSEKAEDMITKFSEGNLITQYTNYDDYKVFKKGQKKIISELVEHRITQIREINQLSLQLLTNSIQDVLVVAKKESRKARALSFAKAEKQLIIEINNLSKEFLNYVQTRKKEIEAMDVDEFQKLAAKDLMFHGLGIIVV
jgi:hypothetical protein